MTDKKTFKIIIADDNPTSRRGLRALLNAFNRTQDHTIEVIGEAENGQQTVNLAQELNPDLIFMDINMPVLNGLDATEIIKTQQQSIKIIILSMHAGKKEDALKKGADMFLAKGTDAQNIKQVLLNFLKSK